MLVAQAAHPGFLTGSSWRLLAPLAGLHAAMLVYDLHHPDRFMNADRARERIQVMGGFQQALHDGNALAYLSSHGIAGDWLPHALLYLLGGQYFVIAVQVILALASVYWLLQIGRRLALGERPAMAAAALYALLPHTLVFPHELATEALYAPLIVLAFYFAVGSSFLASAAAIGCATLIRPVTALWPLIQGIALSRTAAGGAIFISVGLAPLLLWMSFMLATTGELSMGRSGHDLGTNLYNRMHRMAVTLPEAQRPAQRQPGQKRASIGEYGRFVVTHPVEALQHSARDLFVLGVKSGVERLTVDYLDLFPEQRSALQDRQSGWRRQLERRGALATFRNLLGAQPGLVVSSALCALLFAGLMALALLGALRWWRDARIPAPIRRQRLLIVAFVLYTLATAQAVDAAQSRHRTPAEFALCLLAVAGWISARRTSHER